MARLKKKKWSDYMWLVSATYFTLGFFNIVFAWLGVICFMIPLLMAVFGGGKGYYLSQRRISLYIREDYIRERMLNTLVDTLKIFIPKEMMGEGIRKYGIKL